MIKSLEGGRGIAALIVALFHLAVGAEHISLIRNGYLFVDLFFVLSGFVMCAAYGSTMKSTHDFRVFLIRRIGRLYPLLIFSTLVFVLAENVIVLLKQLAYAHGYASVLNNPAAREFAIPTATEILGTITLVHGMGVFDRLILNTPSWSISTEFYTYFLFAGLCLMLNGKARIVAFAVFSLIGFGISVWASTTIHACLQQKGCLSLTSDFGFLRCIYSFFLGAIVYQIAQRNRFNSSMLQIAGCLALFALLSLVDPFPWLAFVFPLCFALLILSVCTDQGWLAAILKRKPFQILGERSYSIYLLHMPLVLFFENIAKRVHDFLPSAAVLVAYVAVLVVISGWTFKFIEDPLRARFNRLASGTRFSSRRGLLSGANKTAD
ncbi:acyltransferase family protein [Noviherbaspirillum massiliense]|uniref:acyltransferase family protein n=1 Tax=Noviherbaspirillum massiliense TaxID=1465823 RepID=UPI0002EDABD3|nr:acyltransferase [Noviherbaspirillum massiliense]